jgi:Arc/MetJ-type ribon-helix-helix transcriptional regulator
MSTASLNISLPQSLKDYVETQVRDSGYSTPSEYARELVREDQKRRGERRLEALLLETKRRQLFDRHTRNIGSKPS